MTLYNTGGVSLSVDVTKMPEVMQEICEILDVSPKKLHFDKDGFDLLDEVYGDLEPNLKNLQERLEDQGIYIRPQDSSIYFYGDEEGQYDFEMKDASHGEWVMYTPEEIAVRSATTEDLIAELKRRDPSYGNKISVQTPAGLIEARAIPGYLGIALLLEKEGCGDPSAIMEFTPTGDHAGHVMLRVYTKENPNEPSEQLRAELLRVS